MERVGTAVDDESSLEGDIRRGLVVVLLIVITSTTATPAAPAAKSTAHAQVGGATLAVYLGGDFDGCDLLPIAIIEGNESWWPCSRACR